MTVNYVMFASIPWMVSNIYKSLPSIMLKSISKSRDGTNIIQLLNSMR